MFCWVREFPFLLSVCQVLFTIIVYLFNLFFPLFSWIFELRLTHWWLSLSLSTTVIQSCKFVVQLYMAELFFYLFFFFPLSFSFSFSLYMYGWGHTHMTHFLVLVWGFRFSVDCEVEIAQSREKWMLLQLTYIPTAEPLIHCFFPFLLFLLSLSLKFLVFGFLDFPVWFKFPSSREGYMYMNRKICCIFRFKY